MNQTRYLFLTATIFLIIALGHLARALLGLEVSIGGWIVPLWLSWLGVLVAGFLSYSGFVGSRKD